MISKETKMRIPDKKPEYPTTMPLILPSQYSNRVVLKSILERSDGGVGLVGQKMVIGGWVKYFKKVWKEYTPELQPAAAEDNDDVVVYHAASDMEISPTGGLLFRSVGETYGGGAMSQSVTSRSTLTPRPSRRPILNLLVSDGSCVASLPVAIELSKAFPVKRLPVGTCILAEGVLNQISEQGKQNVEFKVDKILQIGTVEDDKYPLSRQTWPSETLRECSHLRPRIATVASVMRIRSALTFATYTFFQNNGFLSVQVPIITTTDGEGFSKKFRVTTLSEDEVIKKKQLIADDNEGVSLEAVKAAIKEKNNLLQQLKESDGDRDALFAVELDLLKTSELASYLEAKRKLKSETLIPEDFFSQQTYLTVSGRLHLESYACALGDVYTFGTRFRADKRETEKHLPEMWMVEAEMAFSQLEDAMNCAEDYFKFLCECVLENCSRDMKHIERGRIKFLKAMISCQFVRITYTEAVNVLKEVALRKSEIQPDWGIALTAQHLSYLTDEIYIKPVIVYNFPKGLKPFYVRLNDDGKTVAAFDIVIPKGGGIPIITGSQNEERFDMLNTRINELGLAREQYEWYLDLRRYGTVKHSGFSVGFDLMVLFATGILDVKDAIPFPRSSGKVKN